MSPTAANRAAGPGCICRQMPPRAFDARLRAGVLIDIRKRAEFGAGASAGASAVRRGRPVLPVAVRAPAHARAGDQPAEGLRRTACTAVGAARGARHEAACTTGGASDWTVAGLRPTMR